MKVEINNRNAELVIGGTEQVRNYQRYLDKYRAHLHDKRGSFLMRLHATYAYTKFMRVNDRNVLEPITVPPGERPTDVLPRSHIVRIRGRTAEATIRALQLEREERRKQLRIGVGEPACMATVELNTLAAALTDVGEHARSAARGTIVPLTPDRMDMCAADARTAVRVGRVPLVHLLAQPVQ